MAAFQRNLRMDVITPSDESDAGVSDLHDVHMPRERHRKCNAGGWSTSPLPGARSGRNRSGDVNLEREQDPLAYQSEAGLRHDLLFDDAFGTSRTQNKA
jgi:hypothetical protein